MKTYRVAFIGTGGIVGSHLKAIQLAGDRVELVAAVDLDADKVQKFCQENHVPNWYTDSVQMLAEIQPDLVHIITPPNSHLPLILQCLRAGAWVYCEKPLCASLAQFDQIMEAEEATGRYVNTVFQWRFGSAGQHVKHLMESGELGRPLVGHCQTVWYRDHGYFAVPWRGKWDTELGGPTMGHGIHLTDLFLWLMGDWEEVQAMAATLDREIEVEDISMALVRFENGSLGNITNSVLSPRQETHLRLDFQRVTVECKALYYYNNANWQFTIPDGSADEAVLAEWQTIDEDMTSSHAAQLAEMLDCMDSGKRPLVSGLEARRILEFNASLYKSAFTRQPVQRGSITLDDSFYHAMNGKSQD